MRWTPVAALIIALAVGPAWAEPVTFDPGTLHKRPQTVTIDPQNVTAIQFCDGIAWSAYKAPWLHVSVSSQDKRVLLLDASQTSGEAALMVWVTGDDQPLQLLVRVSPKELSNHLYFVACPPRVTEAPKPAGSSPTVPTPPPSPAGTTGGSGPQAQPAAPVSPATTGAAWDAFVKSLSDRQWNLLVDLIQHPTGDTRKTFEASLSATQQAEWARIVPTGYPVTP